MNRHNPSGGGAKQMVPYSSCIKKDPTSAKPKKAYDVGFYFWVQQTHETVTHSVDLRL
jgi:hypothetical protein